MQRVKNCLFLLCLYGVGASTLVFAQETDQYVTPSAELEDAAPILGHQTMQRILAALEESYQSESPLNEWEITDLIAKRVKKPFNSTTDHWTKDTEREIGRSISFIPKVTQGVFTWVFAPLPASFFFNTKTIRLFAVYLGADKIMHFFKHGFRYFTVYRKGLRRGVSESDAVQRAVEHGVTEEDQFWGYWTSGVYSNGDLAANYAGLMLWRNMTETVNFQGETLVPILVRDDQGRWRVREGVRAEEFLRPFITDRMNEALNPSIYLFSHGLIRKGIRKHCEDFNRFYGFQSRADAVARMAGLDTYQGVDYGHRFPKKPMSILTECF